MTKEIKNVLSLILANHANWKIHLLNNWSTILGPLSSKVYLEKIQEDTLILGVQDSCWLQELYLLSGMLIKTINQTLDQPRIKHLRFKTIGIKKKNNETKPRTKYAAMNQYLSAHTNIKRCKISTTLNYSKL